MPYHDLTRRLHELIASGVRVSWTAHASQRVRERNVPRFEAERVLTNGFVGSIETDAAGRETWKVCGRDTDGGQLDVVVEATDVVVRVVTVIT